jgi:phage baseplate assembly protein W
MTTDFYGQGIAFPLHLGVLGLAQSSGVQRVEESIQLILGTQYGERVMRPDFGCNLRSLAFAPNNDSTANLARYYVQQGLTRWEPRIELVTVEVGNDLARDALTIDLTYRLRTTGDIHNLVYPFYLGRPQ